MKIKNVKKISKENTTKSKKLFKKEKYLKKYIYMKKVIKSTNQIKILFLWVDSDGPPYTRRDIFFHKNVNKKALCVKCECNDLEQRWSN